MKDGSVLVLQTRSPDLFNSYSTTKATLNFVSDEDFLSFLLDAAKPVISYVQSKKHKQNGDYSISNGLKNGHVDSDDLNTSRLKEDSINGTSNGKEDALNIEPTQESIQTTSSSSNQRNSQDPDNVASRHSICCQTNLSIPSTTDSAPAQYRELFRSPWKRSQPGPGEHEPSVKRAKVIEVVVKNEEDGQEDGLRYFPVNLTCGGCPSVNNSDTANDNVETGLNRMTANPAESMPRMRAIRSVSDSLKLPGKADSKISQQRPRGRPKKVNNGGSINCKTVPSEKAELEYRCKICNRMYEDGAVLDRHMTSHRRTTTTKLLPEKDFVRHSLKAPSKFVSRNEQSRGFEEIEVKKSNQMTESSTLPPLAPLNRRRSLAAENVQTPKPLSNDACSSDIEGKSEIPTALSNATKQFKCPKCQYSSKCPEVLWDHLKYCTFDDLNRFSSTNTLIRECCFCAKSFDNAKYLLRHIKEFHSVRKCNLCSVMVSQIASHSHSLTHMSPSRKRCLVCGFSTGSPTQLGKHVLDKHFQSTEIFDTGTLSDSDCIFFCGICNNFKIREKISRVRTHYTEHHSTEPVSYKHRKSRRVSEVDRKPANKESAIKLHESDEEKHLEVIDTPGGLKHDQVPFDGQDQARKSHPIDASSAGFGSKSETSNVLSNFMCPKCKYSSKSPEVLWSHLIHCIFDDLDFFSAANKLTTKCCFCTKTFHDAKALLKHIKRFHSVRKCTICSEVVSQIALHSHSLTHLSSDRQSCLTCSFTSHSAAVTGKHVADMHFQSINTLDVDTLSDSNGHFLCGFCDVPTTWHLFTQMRVHYTECHRKKPSLSEEDINDADKKLKLPKVDKETHSEVVNTPSPAGSGHKSVTSKPLSNFKCPKCKYSSQSPEVLWSHLIHCIFDDLDFFSSTNRSTTKCCFCTKTFGCAKALLRHIKRFHSVRKCTICSEVVSQIAAHSHSLIHMSSDRKTCLDCSFESHSPTYTGIHVLDMHFELTNIFDADTLSDSNGYFLCSFCDVSRIWQKFTQVRVHYTERHSSKSVSDIRKKPSLPEVDGKDYVSRLAIEQPEVDKETHNLEVINTPGVQDELPVTRYFPCSGCQDWYGSMEDLLYHFSSSCISTEAPSKCCFCLKLVKDHSDFDKHMKKAHYLRRCDTCDNNISKLDELSHLDFHGVKMVMGKFTCYGCKLTFSKKQDVLSHIKSEHLHSTDILDSSIIVTRHPSNGEVQWTCVECNIYFNKKFLLLKHRSKEHLCSIR